MKAILKKLSASAYESIAITFGMKAPVWLSFLMPLVTFLMHKETRVHAVHEDQVLNFYKYKNELWTTPQAGG